MPVEDLHAIDVVTTSDEGLPYLRGSSCPACGQRAFPPRTQCGYCYHSPVDDITLSRSGSLYAFSTVHVSSSEKVPYTLAFVDLGDDVRILSKLFGSADDYAIDAAVVLTIDDGVWGFELERATDGEHERKSSRG